MPEDRDTPGIATERHDIGAHPAQRGDKIELPHIGHRRAGFCQIAEMEIAKSVEAVVDRNQHHIAALA
ncbi:hypothetical protein R9J51_15765 [Novosphingobium rhizosphaerae]